MSKPHDHETDDAPLREEDVTAADQLNDRVSEGEGLPDVEDVDDDDEDDED